MSFQTIARGRYGEDVAAQFLVKSGYRILEKNFKTRLGEIDIIAKDGRTICFVEVKMRRTKQQGSPLEAVTKKKQLKLSRLALIYLKNKDMMDQQARFDVVAVSKNQNGDDELTLVKDAFELSGGYSY
ncbi:MAG: YraN family protein [Candidatus Omnitrophota bacterium]